MRVNSKFFMQENFHKEIAKLLNRNRYIYYYICWQRSQYLLRIRRTRNDKEKENIHFIHLKMKNIFSLRKGNVALLYPLIWMQLCVK